MPGTDWGRIKEQLPPEARLILACARADAAAVPVEMVRQLLEQPLDWALIHRLALHHGQLPFLRLHLLRIAPHRIPPDSARVLEAFSAGIREQNQALLETLAGLLARWKGRGLDALPSVEAISSFASYGRVDLRGCARLDFVVRPCDLAKVREAMSAKGGWTELADPIAQIRRPDRVAMSMWAGGPRESLLSFHTATAPWVRAVSLDLMEVWERTALLKLGENEFRALRPEDVLLHLCVFNSEHLWVSLQGIADVAELVRSNPEMDWEATLERGRRSGVLRFLSVGLALAQGLLGAALPGFVARRIEEDPGARLLATRIAVRLLPSVPRPIRTPEMVLTHLRLRERTADRLRYFHRLLTWPSEADLIFLRLPLKLHFLYPWLRPARLAGAAFRRVTGRAVRAIRTSPESVSGYSPSPSLVVERLLEMAEIGPSDVVYDLGCGDGRIVIEAAKRFGVRGMGMDLDPARILESEENARKAGVHGLVAFRNQDVMQADFSAATVVMMYLPPAPTLKLVERLVRELPPGSRILSHNADPGTWDRVEVCTWGSVPSLLYLRRVAGGHRQ